jgi:hypothetical protein
MLFILALACNTATPPSEPDVQPPDQEPVPEAAPATAPAAEEAPEPGPLPPGVPAAEPLVSLVGFGFRLTLNPPFQGALLGKDDTMIVSWWDVNEEGAGQHGRVALYNITLVPAAADTAVSGDFEPVSVERRGGLHTVLRRGTDGPEVRMPQHINALGGMGTLTVGPEDRAWSIEVAGQPPTPWPEGTEMLHSWDPEDGGPFRFQQMPVQPWGPWKAPPPPPPPEAP